MRMAALVWSLCLVGGAALVGPLTKHVAPLAALTNPEAVHIVAHVLLYGTLALLIAKATPGRSLAWAGVGAMLVGVAQEAVQVSMAWRRPGAPEAFDLCVDGAAVALALGLTMLAPRVDRARSQA